MSCQICNRGACARWMHSIEDQERFDERESMSYDVDELRRTVQSLRDEIRKLTTENTMSKRPCHICGSTHWPSPTTTCPLCFGDPDPEPDYDEDEYDHFSGGTEMVTDAMLTEQINHK